MFLLRPLADMADDLQQFVTVQFQVFAFQGDEAGREFVLYPLAGGADLVVRVRRHLGPLPAALVKNRAANRARRRFGQLALGFVAVVLALVYYVIMTNRSADRVKPGGLGVL